MFKRWYHYQAVALIKRKAGCACDSYIMIVARGSWSALSGDSGQFEHRMEQAKRNQVVLSVWLSPSDFGVRSISAPDSELHR